MNYIIKMAMKTKKFNIFGTPWTITYMDKVQAKDDEGFLFGETDAANKTIKIATKNRDGNDLSSRELRNTLYHELIHAILDEGQYCNSSRDEPMVEWLAKCLLSLEGKL